MGAYVPARTRIHTPHIHMRTRPGQPFLIHVVQQDQLAGRPTATAAHQPLAWPQGALNACGGRPCAAAGPGPSPLFPSRQGAWDVVQQGIDLGLCCSMQGPCVRSAFCRGCVSPTRAREHTLHPSLIWCLQVPSWHNRRHAGFSSAAASLRPATPARQCACRICGLGGNQSRPLQQAPPPGQSQPLQTAAVLFGIVGE
jgi:hypothetical protein